VSMGRPLIMGVVNVTPDSFSDGGRFFSETAAVSHARALIADGADLLDIGGESTRPRAEPVSEADEIARVVPVIAAIRAERDIPISVDTLKPAVARAAIAAGASLWNDVTALSGSPGSLAAAAELGCGVILMHMQGRPETMQDDPRYDDVVGEVAAYLEARAGAAMAAGVRRAAIQLDPGIGFGKTAEQSIACLARLDVWRGFDLPLLVGASRKRFIHSITPSEPTERLSGSIAAHLIAVEHGAAIIRTHDVAPTLQSFAVAAAIRRAR
jgi:dihydropteroate synthase